MSDLERILREARSALPEPDPNATERARVAALEAARPSHRTRRFAVSGLALAAALAAAFVAGLGLASGGSTKMVANGPGFLPAAGWETFQTGLVREPQGPTATAATVPLGHDVLDETFPWQTIATLRRGHVLLEALFGPTGDIAGLDAEFPRRSLPLSLADGRGGLVLEGQPAGVSALRLDARVNGWNLELVVFTRGPLTGATRDAAEAELRRLVVPQGRPGPLERRPALRPAPGVCRPSALRAVVQLQGATGSLLGAIRIRNTGRRACELNGRPTVRLRDANGVPLKTQQRPLRPLWQQLGRPRPAGWPVVRVRPRMDVQVAVQLRNWCVLRMKPVFFHAYLPGVGAPIPAPARVTLRCDEPRSPVFLSVGPVEPPTR
jgi:hypothetical protein